MALPVSPTPRETSPAEIAVRPPASRLANWHLGVASVAVASQALSPAMASVGQAALMAVAVARAIDDRRLGAPDPTPVRFVFRRPATVLGLLLVGWVMLAVLWSPDPLEGLARLRPLRAVAFIAALLPVVGRPIPLVLGMLAGVVIETAIQSLMVTGVVPDPHNEPWTLSGGLSPHPGNVGLWAGSAMVLTIGALPYLQLPRWKAAGLAVLAAAGLLSMLLGGNRSLLVGLPFAALVLVAVWMMRATWRRRLQLIAGIVVVIGGLVLIPVLAPGLPSMKRLQDLVTELSPGFGAVEGESLDTSGGVRIFWWREAVPILAAAPLVGHGSGSLETAYDAHIATLDPAVVPKRAHTDNPHSTFVFSLVETGMIGALLGLGFALAAVSDGLRASRIDPRLAGLPAAWALLAAYSIGNTVQLSPYLLFLLCTLAALSIGTVVRRVQEGPRLSAT